jgi:hypothetical protein
MEDGGSGRPKKEHNPDALYVRVKCDQHLLVGVIFKLDGGP